MIKLPHISELSLGANKPTAIVGAIALVLVMVDFADRWGLIRASNTTPSLVLRFEGDDESALDKVKSQFRDLLLNLDDKLNLPF